MITLSKNIIFSLILCLLFSQLQGQSDPTKGFLKIKNDIFWDTKDGQPIYSQGGGIFSFKDPQDGQTKYFWYGAKYQESEKYRNDPSVTPERDNFVSVTCYVSTDLVNWTSHGDVLTLDELNKNSIQTRWAGRLGVAYIEEIDKYALLIQHNDQLLVTLSERPNGPFKWHQRINMTGMIGTSNTGDQTVFTDEDTGKSYLVYSYGRGRNKIYISQIGVKDGKVGLLDCNMVFKGEGREGNCMFKHNGKYYLFASNLYGWDSSFAYYLVSDNIYGPYTPTNEMLIMAGSEADYAHVTQTGFFVTLKGTKKQTVIYCGDRWANFAGNGLGYNQWCPLSFDDQKPMFNSLSSWSLHPTTGEWLVNSDNNYVKNGSFEADRRHIPSPVKPVQEQLLGWQTTIIKGNALSVSDSLSPVLNYFNTSEDRKQVIGEKSLQINDKIDFKRKVSQIIQSSQHVKLADGKYTLSAKFKRGSGFEDLYMYALSNGKVYKQKLSKADQHWSNITLENISIKNGRVEIGFIASGKANAYCHIDDVTLVRSK